MNDGDQVPDHHGIVPIIGVIDKTCIDREFARINIRCGEDHLTEVRSITS